MQAGGGESKISQHWHHLVNFSFDIPVGDIITIRPRKNDDPQCARIHSKEKVLTLKGTKRNNCLPGGGEKGLTQGYIKKK